MAIIKRYSPKLGLKKLDVFIEDTNPDSPYFNITEFPKTFTGGKNAFLFQGSTFFKKASNVRFEILDVEGNTIYVEPGQKYGKTFRDGNSTVLAVHIYDDTPIGIGSISIVAELETYIDNKGRVRNVPNQYKGRPNIRWTQNFKVNPKIPNSTQVRFFKRPTFSVSEIEKSLLIKSNMTLNKSGSVIGIPNTPDTGSDFSNWTAPSQYLIKLQQGNKFTQSMDENTTFVVDSLGYSSSVLEVLNEDEMLVRRPYLVNDIVNEFNAASYSMEFESVEDATIATSSINASYAEIRLENLATFTGDVARIKIFRKSRNDLGDYQVVQENKLDATELLRDFTLADRTVINYGKLRKENVTPYYTTSSGVQIHNEHLINSLLVSGSHSVESTGSIGEFEIISGSEYQFSYSARYSGSGASVAGDSLRFLIVTSSNNTTNCTVTTQSLDLVSGSYDRNSNGLGNIEKTTKNFFSNVTGKAQIRAKANTTNGGGQFYFNKLSLKNAEESSYSPDEYTAVVDIPRKNPTEQFDFRVEFYDINNNFIPIKVEQSVPFTKGNQSRILETAVLVSSSGIADAGDVLSVDASGVVNITTTSIGTSTISTITGLGNPATFSSSIDNQTTQLSVATASLETQTTQLSVSTASLEGTTARLNAETASLRLATSSLMAETASLQAETASLQAETASLQAETASLQAETASLQLATSSLQAETASLQLATSSLQAETASLQAETASLQAGVLNAALTGSLSASVALTGNQDAVLSGSLSASIAETKADNAALSASASGSVEPSTGLITKAPAPSSNGLYLGSTNLGFYSQSKWNSYMDNAGQFFLTGSSSSNYLRWDGQTLSIGGAIEIGSGGTASSITHLNSATSSLATADSNLATSASNAQSTADTATGIANAVAAVTSSLTTPTVFNPNNLTSVTPSGAGLYLGSDKLGFYDSHWKTFMDNSGNFYLGGISGALTWTAATSTLNVNRITATTGTVGGWAIGSSTLGGTTADDTYGTFTLGSTGYISANEFKITAAGVATFKGTIEDSAKLDSGGTAKAWSTIFDTDSTGIYLSVPRYVETGGGAIRTFGARFSGLESSLDSEFTDVANNVSGYSCVLAGTKIISKRGEINVEDTKEDDVIKIFNFETKEWGWSSIDEILTNKVKGWSKIETELGKKLKCSNSHLLYHPDYPNSAIAIDELGVGGELYVYDGEKLVIDKIKSIEIFDEEVEVWNYELDIIHNYVSNGILSHNTSMKAYETTLSHQYIKNKSVSISSGDLVKLDSNNELQKVTTAKDNSIVGILWEKLENEYPSFGLETIGDSTGSKFNSPPENFVSSSFQDSFGNFIPTNETGSKEIWKVAAIGDSVHYNSSGSLYTLQGFKMCNQGGNVVPGDLLCSSDTPGYLMKQPSEWVVTSFDGDNNPQYEERQSQCSYTVAKSMVSSSWDSNGRMENVYGYLYCG